MQLLWIFTVTWLLIARVSAFAAVSTAVGTLSTGTSTGNISVTGLAFQPKVFLLWTAGSATVAGLSFGVATDEATDQQRALWAGAAVGVDPSTATNISLTTKVFTAYNGNGNPPTLLCHASLVSFNTDGFTLNMDTACASAITLNYYALGGADITPALVTFAQPAATDTSHTICASGCAQTVSIPFVADFGMFFSTNATARNTITTDAALNIGMTDGTNATLVSYAEKSASAASESYRYMRSAAAQLEVWSRLTSVAVIDRMTFVSFADVGGEHALTLNIVETAGAAVLVDVLLLDGGQHSIGDVTLSASSTSNFSETGLVFQPVGLWVMSDQSTTQEAVNTGLANGILQLGAASSSTARQASLLRTQSGITDNTQKFSRNTQNLWLHRSSADADDGSLDLVSFDATGFTLDPITSSAFGKLIPYWAIGANVVSATTTRHRIRQY